MHRPQVDTNGGHDVLYCLHYLLSGGGVKRNSDVTRDSMDSKISQFVSQTGADAAVAKDLLHGKCIRQVTDSDDREIVKTAYHEVWSLISFRYVAQLTNCCWLQPIRHVRCQKCANNKVKLECVMWRDIWTGA